MSGDILEVTTWGNVLAGAAKRHPDREAVVFPDRRTTYAELFENATRRSRSLHALDIGPRDHVGILMPNLTEFIEVLFGASLLGAVAVPINARYKETELGYVIENADLDILITTDVVAEHIDYVDLLYRSLPGLEESADPYNLDLASAPRLRSVVAFGESDPLGMISQPDFETAGEAVDPSAIDILQSRVSLRDVCIMMYTSGTTAQPKGCPLTHEALVRTGRAMGRERFLLGQEDRFWDPLPIFHMSAVLPITAVFDAGGTFISMTHFDPDLAIEQIVAERPTAMFPSFPTLTATLIHHPRWSDVDVSSIRIVNNVAPPDTLIEFQAAYPDAIQVSAYGLTEAAGVVSFNELGDTLEQRTTTCGIPFPGIEVRIVDPESDRTVPTDERGEILIRGYCLFEGYYGDPKTTTASVDSEGWLHTGDLGSLDDGGRIRFHGRLKDMLKVGGENVAAVEIESYIGTHPAVKLVQVVGVPDAKYVEVPAAFIELHEGASASADDIIEFCRDKIASFKIPRHVRFVEGWPMSATKIQKYRLREELIGELEGTL